MATTTTTIQPCSADAYIYSAGATTNYGAETNIAIGKNGSGAIWRSLVKWNHATIPSSETCLSATISLWLLKDYATADATWTVYPILRNWVENQATWNAYSTGNNWGAAGLSEAGGDIGASIGVSATIGNATAANTEITISLNAAEFQKYYDGRVTNYGFLIKSTSETANDLWSQYSKENATTARRPKLVVVTQPRTGGSVAMLSDYGVL